MAFIKAPGVGSYPTAAIILQTERAEGCWGGNIGTRHKERKSERVGETERNMNKRIREGKKGEDKEKWNVKKGGTGRR